MICPECGYDTERKMTSSQQRLEEFRIKIAKETPEERQARLDSMNKMFDEIQQDSVRHEEEQEKNRLNWHQILRCKIK